MTSIFAGSDCLKSGDDMYFGALCVVSYDKSSLGLKGLPLTMNEEKSINPAEY